MWQIEVTRPPPSPKCHPLEVVGRGGETQLQVDENSVVFNPLPANLSLNFHPLEVESPDPRPTTSSGWKYLWITEVNNMLRDYYISHLISNTKEQLHSYPPRRVKKYSKTFLYKFDKSATAPIFI